ncbi:hypothetical protein D3C81_1360010 [compost metagenome]
MSRLQMIDVINRRSYHMSNFLCTQRAAKYLEIIDVALIIRITVLGFSDKIILRLAKVTRTKSKITVPSYLDPVYI